MIKEIQKKQDELDQIRASTQEDYNFKIINLIKEYEATLNKLQQDLYLKRKVEIHEIEERKNQHINDLLRNHVQAFTELKDYYNDITEDNLNLIKDLMKDIK